MFFTGSMSQPEKRKYQIPPGKTKVCDRCHKHFDPVPPVESFRNCANRAEVTTFDRFGRLGPSDEVNGVLRDFAGRRAEPENHKHQIPPGKAKMCDRCQKHFDPVPPVESF